GTSGIDELVDKATSENLPAGTEDLALNLEICDQIRSKQVSSKDAAKALKRRISHKNPNVQLLALGAGINHEVKNRLLSLIQTWGRLFRGKKGLGYVCDTYMILQHEGFEFPPVDNVGAALVETEACSSKTMALPSLGVAQEVRVCDGCWMKKKLSGKGTPIPHALGGAPEYVPNVSTATQQRASSTANAGATSAGTEDEDLLKAIELSLKESNSRPGYSAPASKPLEPVKSAPAQAHGDEEDADLLAAIEASLREAKISGPNKSSQSNDTDRQSAYDTYTYTVTQPSTTATAVPSNELTETEKSNIVMFSTLVDRCQMVNEDISGNREIQALYEQISRLQMKLAMSLEEVTRKQQEAVESSQKIDQSVKMYDRLLQERLNLSYERRLTGNIYGQVGIGQPQHYPSSVGSTAPTSSSQAYPQLSGTQPLHNPYVPDAPFVPSHVTQAPYTTCQADPSFQYQTPSTFQPSIMSPHASAPNPGQDIAGAYFAPMVTQQPPQQQQQQYLYQPQNNFMSSAPSVEPLQAQISSPPSAPGQSSFVTGQPMYMGVYQQSMASQNQQPPPQVQSQTHAPQVIDDRPLIEL
ncbi:Vacuolar protein-sorting-associated protein 27, partial [Podila humilis]